VVTETRTSTRRRTLLRGGGQKDLNLRASIACAGGSASRSIRDGRRRGTSARSRRGLLPGDELFRRFRAHPAEGPEPFSSRQPARMCCMVDAIPPIGCQYQPTSRRKGAALRRADDRGSVGAGERRHAVRASRQWRTGTVTLPPRGCGYVSGPGAHDRRSPGRTTIRSASSTRSSSGSPKPGGLSAAIRDVQSILLMNPRDGRLARSTASSACRPSA
jgi:hypothetical protein